MPISSLAITGAASAANSNPIIPNFPGSRASLSSESEYAVDQSCGNMWSIIRACEESADSDHDGVLHRVNRDCLCERDIISSWISCHKCWDRVTYHANQKRKVVSSPYVIDDVTLSLVQSLCDQSAVASIAPNRADFDTDFFNDEDQVEETFDSEEFEKEESDDENSDNEESDKDSDEESGEESDEEVEGENFDEESVKEEGSAEKDTDEEHSNEEEPGTEDSNEPQPIEEIGVADGGVFGSPGCLLGGPGMKPSPKDLGLASEDSGSASFLHPSGDESLAKGSAKNNQDDVTEMGAASPLAHSPSSDIFEDPINVSLGMDYKVKSNANALFASVGLVAIGLLAAWAM